MAFQDHVCRPCTARCIPLPMVAKQQSPSRRFHPARLASRKGCEALKERRIFHFIETILHRQTP
eukprot:3350981-Amphidinium_carterae.1